VPFGATAGLGLHLGVYVSLAAPARRPMSFPVLTGNNASALLQVTALVDPTLQHKNRVEVLVDGPEIVVRPVKARWA
jgi:hypothetical protein